MALVPLLLLLLLPSTLQSPSFIVLQVNFSNFQKSTTVHTHTEHTHTAHSILQCSYRSKNNKWKIFCSVLAGSSIGRRTEVLETHLTNGTHLHAHALSSSLPPLLSLSPFLTRTHKCSRFARAAHASSTEYNA